MWAPRSAGRLGGRPRASSRATGWRRMSLCLPLLAHARGHTKQAGIVSTHRRCSRCPAPPSSCLIVAKVRAGEIEGSGVGSAARGVGGSEASGDSASVRSVPATSARPTPGARFSLSLFLSPRALHTTPCGACGAGAGRMQRPAATQKAPPPPENRIAPAFLPVSTTCCPGSASSSTC